jgi:RNA polymerase sigma factor (sigma-70 family)
VAAMRGGDAEINLRPWLYRIAHNASLNVMRQAGADHDQISDQIDGVETPPQALERGERFRSVVAAVRELPDRQRDALVLQALEGRSYDEIAAELGVTGGAVRQHLNRARTSLREGVTALTPPALLARMGGAIEAPVTERVAQVVAGAGGAAAVAKVAAVVAMTGAVVGGAANGILSHDSRHAGAASAPATAPAKPIADAAVAAPGKSVSLTTRTGSHSKPVTGGREPHRRGGHRHLQSSSGSPERSGASDDSGEHGGSGHSGSGSDDVRHDNSGHGGGSDDPTPTTLSDDHSGSGGSGSSSSGGSGSDDTPLVSDVPDDSGGGSSGKGSGDSRLESGSDDSVSGGGTSGSSH